MQTWPWLAVVVLLLQPLPRLAEGGAIPDPDWQVARGQFTSGIRNREPVDRLVLATPLIREVYFFTDLRHLQGRTVTHRWEYQGEVVAQKRFEVGGPRWRVNSKVEIAPEQVGKWSVTVIDESGWPLYTELFRYEDGAPLLQPSDGPEDDAAVDGSTGEDPAARPAARALKNGLSPNAGDAASDGSAPRSDVVPTDRPAPGLAGGAPGPSE
jgi:hypothetical protein